MTTMSAGWYPDPLQAETVRYFDGEAWTDQTAPAYAPAPPVQAPVNRSAGLGAGMIAGALFPIAGFIWGLVIMFRGFIGAGLLLWLWSFCFAFVWAAVLGVAGA